MPVVTFRRAIAIAAVILMLAAPLVLTPASSVRAEQPGAVQTTLYFGLRTADGAGVSEQAWSRFLAEIVTPHFPDGLTVLDAYGQSDRHDADGAVVGQLTRVLIVVHPASDTATAAVAAIKDAWRERFPDAGLFHTEADVRIVE